MISVNELIDEDFRLGLITEKEREGMKRYWNKNANVIPYDKLPEEYKKTP